MLSEYVMTAAGVKMPRMIYGTAWKAERTADLVEKALRAGFRGVDTACQPKHYNEAGVGEAVERLIRGGVITREAIFLQTKFTPLSGHDSRRIPYNPSAPLAEQVAQSFQTSLRNLQTSFVDSLVLHSPLPTEEELMTVWTAMEQIHRSGGARQLGISNCYDLDTLRRLHARAQVKPAVVQNRFYRETDFDKTLRTWCRTNGVVYQSFWTLTANPDVLQSAAVRRIAQSHGKTAAQVFYRCLMQEDIVPLNGTTSDAHMLEDLAALHFELSDGEVRQVMDLLA